MHDVYFHESFPDKTSLQINLRRNRLIIRLKALCIQSPNLAPRRENYSVHIDSNGRTLQAEPALICSE